MLPPRCHSVELPLDTWRPNGVGHAVITTRHNSHYHPCIMYVEAISIAAVLSKNPKISR